MIEYIAAPHGPQRPYSAAVKAGNFIFVSPQGGRMNHQTNEKMTTVKDQAERCLMGVEDVLKAAGASMKDVVSLNVMVVSHDDLEGLNEAVKDKFPDGLPARNTFCGPLPHPEMLTMIGAIAWVEK